MMTVHDSRLIHLPRIQNRSGNLTFVEGDKNIPFDIKRVFYIYDIPGGEDRGSHAHKTLHQLAISIMGSFDVTLHDGLEEKQYRLDRAYYGLYIPPGLWTSIASFSSGGICMVLASDVFHEEDYIRDLNRFHDYRKNIL